MPDHYDHVHIGYHPVEAGNPLEAQFSALLKPDQWQRLIGRLGQIENPEVPIEPSKYSLPDKTKTGGETAANGGRPAKTSRPGESRPLAKLFGFAQLDFAGPLPLADGRYLARDEASARAFSSCRRWERRRLRPRRRRRPREAEPDAEPSPLPLTRATAVRAFAPFESEEEAGRWLDEATEAEDTADVLVADGIDLLNRALHAHAVAGADPHGLS